MCQLSIRQNSTNQCSTLHHALMILCTGLDGWWFTTAKTQHDGKYVRLFKFPCVTKRLTFCEKWFHGLKHFFCDHGTCLSALHHQSIQFDCMLSHRINGGK